MAVLAVGNHEVEVIASALSESQQTKSQQIMVQFADANGDGITAYLACSEAAWQYTEEKLRTLGWDAPKNGYRFEELNLDPSPLKGQRVRITVKEETYKGKTRAKVDGIWPLFERMEAGEAKSFAEKLRARILNGSTGSAAKVGSGRKSLEPDPNEDDIPF